MMGGEFTKPKDYNVDSDDYDCAVIYQRFSVEMDFDAYKWTGNICHIPPATINPPTLKFTSRLFAHPEVSNLSPGTAYTQWVEDIPIFPT